MSKDDPNHGHLAPREAMESQIALPEGTNFLSMVDDFVPDAVHINALPEKLRQYIHDLETDADPAGDKARLLMLKEQVDGLSHLYAEAKDELHALHCMVDDVAWDTIENDGTFVTVRVKALDRLLATRERKP